MNHEVSKSRKRLERRKKLKNIIKIHRTKTFTSSLNKVVIDGYFRFIQSNLNIIIINEVRRIIISYIKTYLIYGCGRNNQGFTVTKQIFEYYIEEMYGLYEETILIINESINQIQ